MKLRLPAAPAGLRRGGRGRRLWREVLGVLDLDGHEAALLAEACRTLDLLDNLGEEARRLGSLLPDGRIQPCIVEARLQRIALSRIIASLRLPADMTQPERRPQRRNAARGAYGFRVVGRDA